MKTVTQKCVFCGSDLSTKWAKKYCSTKCLAAALTPPIGSRFWSRVKKGAGCWLWTGQKCPDGYGSFRVRKRAVGAHRFAYELCVGAIPLGMYVCHTCDVRACVNPAHLWLGTNADNMRDMAQKGRAYRGGPTQPRPLRGAANGNARLTEIDVRAILTMTESSGFVGQKFGVSKDCIQSIRKRRTWRHVA